MQAMNRKEGSHPVSKNRFYLTIAVFLFLICLAGLPSTIMAETVSQETENPLPVKNTLPSVKLGKVVSAGNTSLRITWTTVKGADGYYVYRKENDKWVQIASVEAPQHSYVHTSSAAHKILPAVKYAYTVRTWIRSGDKKLLGVPAYSSIRGQTSPHKLWVTEANKSYYYLNGKKVYGWRKIGSYTYFFDKKDGHLKKNAIVGDSSGYYYVDGSGIRVTDKVMKQAVAYVRKYTKNGWTREQKLKKCYDVMWSVYRYGGPHDAVSKSKMPSYAAYMFTNKKGNCYRGAVALAYAAKAIGYEVRVGVGGVSSHPTGSLSTHGWTEIKKDDVWYMCDTSMQRPRPKTSLYMLDPAKYPFRLRRDDVYTMKIVKGVVKWL